MKHSVWSDLSSSFKLKAQALALSGLAFLVLCPAYSFAMAPAAPTPPPSSWNGATSSAQALPLSSSGAVFQNGNLIFDLSNIEDPLLEARILSALKLGFERASVGKVSVGQEIRNLRADGATRVIEFYSDASQLGRSDIGTVAFSDWSSPSGEDSIDSPPDSRSELKIFIRPGIDYWYVVNNVWHELLHMTLTITHSQTTTEGPVPTSEVNDGLWYTTIERIMLDFPRTAVDPVTGKTEELYNPESSPWS